MSTYLTPWSHGAPRIVRDFRAVFDQPSGRDLVVLVDGLGLDALSAHKAHTPNLRAHWGRIQGRTSVLPSTTSTALTTFLTGESPLVHGVLGYAAMTGEDTSFSHLQGAPGLGGNDWRIGPTLGRSAAKRGRTLVHVGPKRYARSFFTEILHGDADWSFVGYARDDERVAAVRDGLSCAGKRGLVYLHVPDVDKAGHAYGPGSPEWIAALENADALLGTLMRIAPSGTRLTVTSDHGMVEARRDLIHDLADAPALCAHPTVVAGEGRALLVRYRAATDDATASAVDALRSWVGERGTVCDAHELATGGILGPTDISVSHSVRGRLGDALIFASGNHQFTHRDFISAASLEQRGVHGSDSRAEMRIPYLRVTL